MEFLHSNELTKGPAGSSTQKYVDVEEVRDGVMILKNGTLRAVLMVSSINFDLKATEEQDAIIAQYQNFINSLDFPIQILISSRKLNLEPYLDFIKEKESQLTNELLTFQLGEYRNFIKNLTEVSNIMTKYFYLVVPFAPIENKKGGFFENLFNGSSGKKIISNRLDIFNTYKSQLWQRVEHINAGLASTGVKVVPLKTEELIELLYNSYNPTTHSNSIIKDTGKVELR
jgi:hypothetical protein